MAVLRFPYDEFKLRVHIVDRLAYTRSIIKDLRGRGPLNNPIAERHVGRLVVMLRASRITMNLMICIPGDRASCVYGCEPIMREPSNEVIAVG